MTCSYSDHDRQVLLYGDAVTMDYPLYREVTGSTVCRSRGDTASDHYRQVPLYRKVACLYSDH